jgi:2-keto-4-pentenoate hydratase/2-oxohepta-3-ene-1,7-dioic acid hydratase in catechol pathway
MKLVTFVSPVSPFGRIGTLIADGQTIVDLQAGAVAMNGQPSPVLADMLSFLDGGEFAREEAERIVESVKEQAPPGVTLQLDAVTLLAPVPCPRSIRDFMAFEKHVIQSTRMAARNRSRLVARVDGWVERLCGKAVLAPRKVWYERPLYYKGNPRSVVGPEVEIRWPKYTQKLDYELEYGIVIGRKGRDIPASQARDHIAGYTIFNDFSARDVQLQEMSGWLGPAKGKDFDTGNALGPCLVTADEVPDPYSLTMVACVNGEQWSSGSSRDMRYTFEEMIAYISQDETLHPGEFIGSGTPGNGCGLELDRWLKPGDVVELEVERLGILRNRIAAPAKT